MSSTVRAGASNPDDPDATDATDGASTRVHQPSAGWPITVGVGATRARVRPWWVDPSVAQLTIVDHGVMPSSANVQIWLNELQAYGFSGVRTGAVTEAGADVMRRHGFVTAQALHLLDLSLIGWEPPEATTTTRRMRRGDQTRAADVDRAAFGEPWSMDVTGIVETCAATPTHRARVVTDGSTLRGFAITGRADRTGYLQRLAVHPDSQGRGLGVSLTADSLRWMQRRRLTRAVVNTHVDNRVALGLYARLGFRILPQRLYVLERRFGQG